MNMDFKVAEVELTYKPGDNKKSSITTASDACKMIRATYPEGTIEYKEYFKVLLLNNNSEVIAYNTVGVGGITDCPVDIRLLLQSALLTNATNMILAHNHPSGRLRPSREDDRITKEIADAAKMLRLRVMDHIIITKDDYYSYAENGKL